MNSSTTTSLLAFAAKRNLNFFDLRKLVLRRSITEQLLGFWPSEQAIAGEWGLLKLRIVLAANGDDPIALERALLEQKLPDEAYAHNGFYCEATWRISQGLYSAFALLREPRMRRLLETVPRHVIEEDLGIRDLDAFLKRLQAQGHKVY